MQASTLYPKRAPCYSTAGMERAGTDINARDGAGQTVLHIASLKGFVPLVKILLRKVGLSLNLQDDEGQTPLHLAAQGGHEKVCEILVDAGAGMLFFELS